MATFLGITALFTAIVAMWLANDALKKVDDKNDKFIRTYVSDVRGSVEDAIAASQNTVREVISLKERLDTLEQNIAAMKNMDESMSDNFDSKINMLRSDLATLGAETAKLDDKILKFEEAEPDKPESADES